MFTKIGFHRVNMFHVKHYNYCRENKLLDLYFTDGTKECYEITDEEYDYFEGETIRE